MPNLYYYNLKTISHNKQDRNQNSVVPEYRSSYLAEVTLCAVFWSCARLTVSTHTRRFLAIDYLLL